MSGRVRALVVDDDPDAADLLGEVLRLGGCDVRVCHSGGTAVNAAAEFRPHVCFVDLLMPDSDGATVAASLRALPAPPRLLVCVSGLSEGPAAERTGPAGFHLHVVKPGNPDDLVMIARSVEPVDD